MTAEKKQSSAPEETVNLWQDARLLVTDKFESPPVILKVENSIIGTLGNFSASTGKAKSKKTFNVCAIVAAAMTGGTVLNYTASLPLAKRKILYVDTEQSRFHCQRVLLRILRLAALSEDVHPDGLEFLCLRGFATKERLKLIETAIYEIEELGLVIIDGLRDLAHDINSPGESTDLITKLMRWTDERKIPGILRNIPCLTSKKSLRYLVQVAALRGERKEIIFQDGSKVYLNAGTQISYPQHFGLSERRVVLNGEAYFEVTPNARRPFIVEAGDASVKVLGTSFNMKAYDSEQTLNVVLLSGSVEFSYGDYRYTMQPSQKLVLDKSRGQVNIYEQENASRAALWRSDVISFRDTPLSEVIATLERWYDVKFEVLNDGAYRSTFTLQTNLLPLSELLREMENISTVQFEEQGDVVRVSLQK